ncbi:MAG: hypothetical protein NDJ89_05235 [Oligoflexia bacterium]|nr:hypothetical protein [Oligoflexia bacterium]
MPTTARKNRKHAPTRPRLRAVEPPKEAKGGIDELLSGKVTARPKAARRGGRKRPVESIPPKLVALAEVFVAGRKIEREVEFKRRYAEQKVKEYCVRRYSEIYAATGERPPAIDYQGERAQFTFVQTRRINLNAEKVEALRSLGVAIDQYTELKGIRINYEAIRRHRLEKPLREALEKMGVSDEILQECFEPIIQPKDSFFGMLDNLVLKSLQKGEELPEKLQETLGILQPANQIRNADLPSLNANECFELIHSAEISVPEAESELDIA